MHLDGANPTGRSHGIPAWSKPAKTVVARGVRDGARPRKKSALLTLETRSHRHHLNARDRVAVLIQNNTGHGIHQLQTENEIVPKLAGCELDNRRRATKRVSAVDGPLI